MQAKVTQPGKACQRVTRQQQLQHLVEQACGRHVVEQRGQGRDRLFGCGIDGKLQLRGQPRRSQHAYRILAKACLRIADHDHALFLDIGNAADVVQDLFLRRIVEQRVHGEIAADGVFFLVAEYIVAQQSPMFVGAGIAVVGFRVAMA